MLARTTLLRLAVPVALAVPLTIPLALTLARALFPHPAPLPSLLAVAADDVAWPDSPGGQLIFFAVLEGLYTDGVQDEVVRAVLRGPPERVQAAESLDASPSADAAWQRELERTLFVPACPLCTPALVAFETYAARGPLHLKAWRADGRLRDTFGPGLPDEVVARFQSDDRAERLAALQGLITSWIARRLDLGRATATERENFLHWMEDGRKRGMEQLTALRQDLDAAAAATWTRCATCDGSVEGCMR